MPDYPTHDDAEQAILDRSVLRAGGTIITPSAVGVIGLITRAAVGQTASLQEWQDSAGTLIAKFGAAGAFIATGGSSGGAIRAENATASTVGIVVKGAASQTANLQEWQDSVGSVKSQIWSDGRFFVGPTVPGGMIGISTDLANRVGFIIRGAASQTANLQEWQNSAGTVLAKVGAAGLIETTGSAWIDSGGGNTFGAVIRSTVATHIAAIIRGAASQSANLQEWQDSAGTVKASVSDSGNIVTQGNTFIGGFYSGTGRLGVVATAADVKGITIRGAASQTANLAEFQNSSGTVLSSIGNDGLLFVHVPAIAYNRAVQFGAADSGGSGFRMMRVAN